MLVEQTLEEQDIAPTHKVVAFRLQNFMGFSDTNWIELDPVTLLFGRNSTGKSAIIRALRLLKQSLNNGVDPIDPDNGVLDPLVFTQEGGVDLGRYEDFIYQHNADLPLSFWFKVWVPPDITADKDKGRVGDFRTEREYVVLRLIYEKGYSPLNVRLSGVAIYDGSEKSPFSTILSMDKIDEEPVGLDTFTHPKDDEYWTVESDFVKVDTHKHQSLWRIVRPTPTQGFLIWLNRPGASFEKGKYADTFGEDVSSGFRFLEDLSAYLNKQITDFLQSLVYIGPMREEPQRFYYSPYQATDNVGSHGQYSIGAFLVRRVNSDGEAYLDRIRNWLSESSLRSRLEVEPITEHPPLYQVFLMEDDKIHKGFKSNIKDVGFGVSQILPVLIEGLFTGTSRLIIIEQPELHLHPQAQAEMGDLFILMAQQGIRFFLETHSESLLLRFRRRLAETTGNVSDAVGLPLSNDDFQAYFVDRQGGKSTLEALAFDEWGDYIYRPARFGDFFGQDFAELAKMKKARRTR